MTNFLLTPMEGMLSLLYWFKPRAIIHHLSVDYSKSTHFRVIAALSVIYFIQISIFILSIDRIPSSAFFSFKGLQAIPLLLLLIGLATYTLINMSTLIIWICTKWLKGKGSLPQTRSALLCAAICSTPIGFFCLLFQFTFNRPNLEGIAIPINIISFIGLISVLISGLIVMVKVLSRVHKITILRSLFSIIFGNLLLFVLLFFIFRYFTH